MKKYLFLAAFLPLLLAACKKSGGSGSTGGDYYMKFKLNGTQKSYSTVSAVTSETGGYHTLALSGAAATSAQSGEAMVILLNSTTAFTAGQTFSATMLRGIPAIQALLSYAESSQSGKGYTSSYPNITPGATATVTITAIDAAHVKGTFSCQLVDESDYTTVKYTVTEGEFNSRLTGQ
ncbi:MAG TPA: hypothetical protein VHD83_11175 [Puia sp.]|nr:hypothetical protein [Puia sp.]